ncbi:hypothetical protein [Candidatus Enterococcus leclercqii]|uniref:carboxylate--amine ligase n=1 Tax=Candidatus Enterococcus leclercqii TaxID=1857218 RepID=UPI00137A5D21|nr:hypothetical protein [Enterococcus sp. CU9D]KAF1294071.1 hypothetical protein BAU14_07820 [Enterococcus sp. CU9D]
MNFLPVILGTDVNAYGIARSVHMAYGVKSLCVGQGKLLMTNHSKILKIQVVEGLTAPENFADALIAVADEQLKHYDKLILFAASDGYAELVINNQERLKDYYALPFVQQDLLQELILKENFYDLAEEIGLDHPATVKVNGTNYQKVSCPFGFPMAVKPSNSVKYAEVDFEGKKKAYIVKDEAELKEVLAAVYSSDYQETMLIQDFIPGPDSNMRVLNAYVGKDGKVQLMCLGHPYLEDVTPILVGNYVAIKSTANMEIYQKYQDFLEKIGYHGFANFDMKYDPRDGKFKIFEINLRPGRSSFYTTLAGCNLMQAAIEDLIFEKDVPQTVYGDKEYLWLGVPESVVTTYTEDPKLQAEAEKLINEGNYGFTLIYDEDKSLLRNQAVKKYYAGYPERYQKWFEKKGDA